MSHLTRKVSEPIKISRWQPFSQDGRGTIKWYDRSVGDTGTEIGMNTLLGQLLSRSSSDEPSIVASSHPGSPYIQPAHWCFVLLRLS